MEIKDEDAAPVDASSEVSEVVEYGVGPAVSRLQPAFEDLGVVGGAAGGVSGGQGMEVEVNMNDVSQRDLELIRLAVNDPQTGFKCPYCGGRSWVGIDDKLNLLCMVCGHRAAFNWAALKQKGRRYAEQKGITEILKDVKIAEGGRL